MHILLVTGGSLDNNWAKSYINSIEYDKVIALDRGLFYCSLLDIKPDIIMGDYDSVDQLLFDNYKANIEKDNIFIYPSEKDYTDTHIGVMKAIELGANEVTIIGGTGTRLDHVWANVGVLKECVDAGVKAYVVDPTNRISIMDSTHTVTINKTEQYGEYVSLLPYSEKVTGVDLTGFKYPLLDATFTIGASLGISNEIIDAGSISIKTGYLIIVESMD